jgi:hypothetical protein
MVEKHENFDMDIFLFLFTVLSLWHPLLEIHCPCRHCHTHCPGCQLAVFSPYKGSSAWRPRLPVLNGDFGCVGDGTLPHRLPLGRHRLEPLCGGLARLPHEASGGPSWPLVEDSNDSLIQVAYGLANKTYATWSTTLDTVSFPLNCQWSWFPYIKISSL